MCKERIIFTFTRKCNLSLKKSMKNKILISIAIACVYGLASCTDVLNDGPYIPVSEGAVQNARTSGEAISIALNAATIFGTGNVAEMSRSNDVSSQVITSVNSRSGYVDTLLHIVNFGENDGFAVIGGPLGSDPLLAYIEEGNFNDSSVSENESFQYFMECALHQMSITPVYNDSALVETPYKYIVEREWLLEKEGGTKLPYEWGQGDSRQNGLCEGYYCPNKISGCVMTASLIAMAYFAEPAQMTLTFPERDCDSIRLNWMSIRTHHHSHDVNLEESSKLGLVQPVRGDCTASLQDHLNIGRIARQIGYEIGAGYSNSGTGAYTSKLVPHLVSNYFTNTTYTILDSKSRDEDIMDMMDAGISITRGNGHAWISDAYRVMKYYDVRYLCNTETGEKVVDSFYLPGTECFIHNNWGWYGSCNGYFKIGVFKLYEAFIYDNGNGYAPSETYTPTYYFITKTE